MTLLDSERNAPLGCENFYMENILKYRHHTEQSSIDNMIIAVHADFLVHADLPVLLFVYRHFTKYKLYTHQIDYCVLVPSH